MRSFQMAEIVYDGTVLFCRRFVDRRSRTTDQMVQAARSGRQNIPEGCQASGTSKKTELKLLNVARASLEELLLDVEDALRQNSATRWDLGHPEVSKIRSLARLPERSFETCRPFIETGSPEMAANTLLCLIHQTNYLLDNQLRELERAFLREGGFTERLYRMRKEARDGK